jgi:hypothetical protein
MCFCFDTQTIQTYGKNWVNQSTCIISRLVIKRLPMITKLNSIAHISKIKIYIDHNMISVIAYDCD